MGNETYMVRSVAVGYREGATLTRDIQVAGLDLDKLLAPPPGTDLLRIGHPHAPSFDHVDQVVRNRFTGEIQKNRIFSLGSEDLSEVLRP